MLIFCNKDFISLYVRYIGIVSFSKFFDYVFIFCNKDLFLLLDSIKLS